MEKVLLVGFNKQFTQLASTVLSSEIHTDAKDKTHYKVTAVGELKRLPSFSCETDFLLCPEGFPMNKKIKVGFVYRCGMSSSCDYTLSSTGSSPVDGNYFEDNPRAVLAFGKTAEVEFAQEIAFDAHRGISPYENIILESIKHLIGIK